MQAINKTLHLFYVCMKGTHYICDICVCVYACICAHVCVGRGIKHVSSLTEQPIFLHNLDFSLKTPVSTLDWKWHLRDVSTITQLSSPLSVRISLKLVSTSSFLLTGLEDNLAGTVKQLSLQMCAGNVWLAHS